MLHKSRFAAHLSVAAIVTGILTALPASAQAADPAQEAATAGLHAGLAAKAATIEQVHMHLHHTVNCLVGPAGQGFDAKEANPCQKLGNGAIPDKRFSDEGQTDHSARESTGGAQIRRSDCSKKGGHRGGSSPQIVLIDRDSAKS